MIKSYFYFRLHNAHEITGFKLIDAKSKEVFLL